MDEPLSNLDAGLRVQMRGELTRLHEQLGVTTLYVTHDQVEAMTMGDRIAIMDRGRLQQIDAPEAIYARPANLFVAAFVGSPRMNLVDGALVPANGRPAVSCLETTLELPPELHEGAARAPDSAVVVGVRSEDLRWAREAPPEATVRLAGDAEIVEPLGAETLVTVAVGNHRLICRFPPRCGVAPGDGVEVALDPAHLHVFEKEAGDSLLARERRGS